MKRGGREGEVETDGLAGRDPDRGEERHAGRGGKVEAKTTGS